MNTKIDITSTAIEKGFDVAKNFLEKLIMPTVEETGLLIKDRVTLWRFNNQIKMLIKAKEKCDKLGVHPKTVSLKVLCPLLEYAGLEEDEILQDKWSNLLANMVDSEQNIENHVFPYLLSQVSVDEFMLIENVFKMKIERVKRLESDLKDFSTHKSKLEEEIKNEIKELDKQINEEKGKSQNIWDIQRKKWDKEKELRTLGSKERTIMNSIKQPELIPIGELKEYELSNLIRLGIIKSIPKPYAYVQDHKIRNEPESEFLHLQDLEITIDTEEEILFLTELGELFISACNEKR